MNWGTGLSVSTIIRGSHPSKAGIRTSSHVSQINSALIIFCFPLPNGYILHCRGARMAGRHHCTCSSIRFSPFSHLFWYPGCRPHKALSHYWSGFVHSPLCTTVVLTYPPPTSTCPHLVHALSALCLLVIYRTCWKKTPAPGCRGVAAKDRARDPLRAGLSL